MIEIRTTEAYDRWFGELRDHVARARIGARIRLLSVGHSGDAKAVGKSVHELRIHYGPGYRVYFVRRGEAVIVLLAGGDKGSQSRDIARAVRMAEMLG